MLDYGRTFMGDVILSPTCYGPWVDISYYDENDLQDETVINNAVLGQSGQTVLLCSRLFTISNNITLPENITLMCVNKGELSINAGITFTVTGITITNGRIIHSGLGTMKYGKTCLFSSLIPEGYLYAKPGSVCFHTTETSGRLYVKQSGDNTNTGWVVK